ncbi:hypothetical protein Q8A67_018409 [Cirrhinus molitorella]|uniref:Uncharacterized protein n=1 Tax=Cirrhinus molitorella TaxID=172907 RepID=A0AA88TEQ1_9TELE|nr:hypothetical protein Q8A67_018409 [Cirrhinus molitorella]
MALRQCNQSPLEKSTDGLLHKVTNPLSLGGRAWDCSPTAGDWLFKQVLDGGWMTRRIVCVLCSEKKGDEEYLGGSDSRSSASCDAEGQRPCIWMSLERTPSQFQKDPVECTMQRAIPPNDLD